MFGLCVEISRRNSSGLRIPTSISFAVRPSGRSGEKTTCCWMTRKNRSWTCCHLLLELVRKGYENQILISGDTARKTYYKHYDYGLGLEYIIAKWVPRFIDEANKAGFDGDKLVEKFFVTNPANCFAFKR